MNVDITLLRRILAMEEKTLSDPPPQFKGNSTGQLTIVHASKPHSQAITALAVNHEGTLLATGVRYCLVLYCSISTLSYTQGADSSVFFMSVQDQYSAIGFTSTPSPVVCMQWTTTESKVLCTVAHIKQSIIHSPLSSAVSML